MAAVRPLDVDNKRDRRIGLKRLLKLADGLETVPEKAFDFGTVMEIGENQPRKALAKGGGCGTVGCAMGWAPAFLPKVLEWTHDFGAPDVVPCGSGLEYMGYNDAAMQAFALTYEESDYLFSPGERYSGLMASATAKQVARHIRKWANARLKEMA